MRKTIAIGPETHRPTWTWVGFDLARELSKYYNIRVFNREGVPPSDAAILVKEPLAPNLLDLFGLKKVIYFPCDYYLSKQDMEQDEFLKRCSAVISHSKHLLDNVKEFNPRVFHVNHNGKYILPKINEYKEDGFILWVGFSLYIPYLRQWLRKHPLDKKLVILTDFRNRERISGKVEQRTWTPRLQFELMSLAKAAIDIKGDDFNQLNKPTHKLEAFIASGIPSACNSSPISDYLKKKGLNIPEPHDTKRWFSREYYEETVEFGKKLREEVSLTNVGLEVKRIIDDTLLR